MFKKIVVSALLLTVGLVTGQDDGTDNSAATYREMVVSQYYVKNGENVVVNGQVTGQPSVDYCKYTRFDGIVFVASNVSSHYRAREDLTQGHCNLYIIGAEPVDQGPWTISALVSGADPSAELSRVTVPERYPNMYPREMEVSQYQAVSGGNLIISGKVTGEPPLERCKFTRFDGVEFTPETMVSPYINRSVMAIGHCRMMVVGPKPIDFRTWKVSALIAGSSEGGEMTRETVLEKRVDDYASFVDVQQYLVREHNLIVSGQVNGELPLEYCKFTRPDGIVFTEDNLPTGYLDRNVLNLGHCRLYIPNAGPETMGPWKVTLKVAGESREISRTTIADWQTRGTNYTYIATMTWLSSILSVVSLIAVILMLVSNRKMQNNYLHSMQSTAPLPANDMNQKHAPLP